MAKLVGAGILSGAFIVVASQVPFVVSLFLIVLTAMGVVAMLLDWAASLEPVYEPPDRSEPL